MQTAKHDLMRNTNTLSILECIRQFGPITKREIQVRTGLSWGAISNIITDLFNKRVISETKSAESLIGRIPCKFDISNNDNLIIGVDINIEGLTAVLIDLKNRMIKSAKINIIKNDRDGILEQTKQIIHNLIKDSNVNKKKIIGIGVAMQGAVDAEKGISIFSPHFRGWQDVPVKDMLEKEFNIPVLVEHDPNCMALSERWMGAANGVNNLLFIRLSMAIGMSIIINGVLYKGLDGSAGEFGHVTMNPSGPKCSCGNYGCLETYVSGNNILQKAIEGIKIGRNTVLSGFLEHMQDLELVNVIEAARQGDDFACGLFDEAGIYLGIGISNLISILNPDLIIIGGEMIKCEDLFLKRTREVISQKAWKNSRVNLVTSRLENNSAAIGAATIFVQKIFSGEMLDVVS